MYLLLEASPAIVAQRSIEIPAIDVASTSKLPYKCGDESNCEGLKGEGSLFPMLTLVIVHRTAADFRYHL
jgi:hypothetical protein